MITKKERDKQYNKEKLTEKEREKRDVLFKAVHKIVFDQWETMTTQWVEMNRRLRKLEEDNLALYRMIKNSHK